MKAFPTSVLISVASGVFIAESFSSIQECIEYTLDRPVFTHALPSAVEPVQAMIYAVYPDLQTADVEGVNRHNVHERIAQFNRQFGATRELPTLSEWAAIEGRQ